MKIRFFAALLAAALSISLMGCAVPGQQLIAPSKIPEVSPAAADTFVPEIQIPTEAAPVIPEPQAPTEAAPVTPEPQVPAAPAPKPEAAPAVSPAAEPVRAAPEPARISKDDAIAIALKDAGLSKEQVSRLKAEFDYDDGVPEYDVEFRHDGWEYEYEIHAESGRILKRDKDRDD